MKNYHSQFRDLFFFALGMLGTLLVDVLLDHPFMKAIARSIFGDG